VFWYRKSLLDAAGVTTPPTTWDEFHSACAALKKTGVFGYSAGTGAGNNLGVQQILAMMINNGGGVWNEGAELDCTFDRNVEAVDFIMSLAKEGFIDPSAVSYTTDNQNAQWKAKKFAMGIETGGLADNIGDTSGDVQVMSPMSALHGDKGALVYINNLMMYTEAPNKEGAEAFLAYYIKNLPTYWKQNLGTGLPAFKSIVELPEFQANKNSLKIVNEYQPVFKTLAARGNTLSIKEAQIDSTAPMFTFAQTVYSGKGTAKDALAQLQQGLSALVK
jgi:multiple sugar transport system substrate-binding protein